MKKTLFAAVAISLSLAGLSGAAEAASLTSGKRLEVKVDPDNVAADTAALWKQFGGWCAIAEWHPSVETCEEIKDGDTVSSPVVIRFGLAGMGVAPAGVEDKKNTGHHHLVIDEKIEGDELNAPIPSDDKHRHFGKGQTEASIKLSPGKHTLQLVLGDWSHVPHNPPVMSERITVTVE